MQGEDGQKHKMNDEVHVKISLPGGREVAHQGKVYACSEDVLVLRKDYAHTHKKADYVYVNLKLATVCKVEVSSVASEAPTIAGQVSERTQRERLKTAAQKHEKEIWRVGKGVTAEMQHFFDALLPNFPAARWAIPSHEAQDPFFLGALDPVPGMIIIPVENIRDAFIALSHPYEDSGSIKVSAPDAAGKEFVESRVVNRLREVVGQVSKLGRDKASAQS